MWIVITVLALINIGTIFFFVWVGKRLNRYIAQLENLIEEQIERNDQTDNVLLELKLKNKKIIKRNLMPDEQDA